MKSPEKNSPIKLPLGWICVGLGVSLFLIGIALRTFLSGTIADTRILEGIGILLIGVGIIPLSRSISARRDPLGARRSQLAESDERAVSFRNKAGFNAFLFSMVVNNAVLITYSALTRGQPGFDPIWFTLIFLAVAPIIVFAGVMVWQNREN